MDPWNVKNIRFVLRKARAMLDVFSPVFPDEAYFDSHKSHAGKDLSLWRKLRKEYKTGYEIMGNLEDLFDVSYTDKMLKKRVKAVMNWRTKFKQMMKTYRVRRYLYSDYSTGLGGIDPDGHYIHDSSHLFWS